MLNRNARAPWLYAAGGVMLGLVGFKAVSMLKRRGSSFSETPNDGYAPNEAPQNEQKLDSAGSQHSGEIAVHEDGTEPARTDHERPEERRSHRDRPPTARSHLAHQEEDDSRERPVAFVRETLDDELEAALGGAASVRGDAYDAVGTDDLASEWLSRATEGSVVAFSDEPLDPEIAALFREAGISVVSEGTLNYASAEQLEAAVRVDLEGPSDQLDLDLEFDDSGLAIRQ